MRAGLATRAALLLLGAGCGTPSDPGDDDTADTTDLTPDTDTPARDVSAGDDVEVALDTPATLHGAATGDVADATWDFGDGSTADGLDAVHTYVAPGNYVATLSVRFEDGSRRTDTARVTAYRPASVPPPVAASPLALDAARDRLWVAVPEADHVAVVDLRTHDVAYVHTCDGPRTVAVHDDVAAVACEEDDTVAFFQAGAAIEALAAVTTPLPRGSRPFAVVPQGVGWAVTAQGTGDLIHVDDAFDVTDAAALGPDPRALVVDGAGAAYATRFRTTGTTAQVLTTGAPIDLAHDPGPDSDTGNRGVPTVLRALAASPDGHTLYVGATLANVDRGLYRDGLPLTFEATERATLRVVRDGVEDFEARKQLDNHGDVSALALSPRGNWLWMAHMGTGTLSRLDAYTLRAAGVILDAGHGVDGLAVSPDGATLFVHAWLDRELRAYDISDPSIANPPVAWRVATVASEPLAADVLRGKVLFHDASDRRLARDGYLSCAGCHPDGRDDGITWDFTDRGEGLRNTISLLGHGGTGQGPVHWTGNFDEIQDFEGDIRHAQGGTGLLEEADWLATEDALGAPKAGRSADLDALAAYVASLVRAPTSPFDAPAGATDLADTRRCTTCHTPGPWTDSTLDQRHDVGTIGPGSGQRRGGTLDGFDTPTLVGTFLTAPYLHDGSAPTVEDAIRAHDPAVTGGSLDADDVAALAALVRSL
ncbi:MAG: PKD domain-containing protein [Alphaproteobacteria bacterium]|nr:PKD domain-containing protein [Alphaproteobacteria bacterium]